MNELENIPVLRLLKEPVAKLNDLYTRYADGGEYGWFAFVEEINTFASWDVANKQWRTINTSEIAVLNSLGVSTTNPVSQDLVTKELAKKVPIESPALQGTPTAPTQSTSDNSTRLATTEFTKNAISQRFGSDFKVEILKRLLASGENINPAEWENGDLVAYHYENTGNNIVDSSVAQIMEWDAGQGLNGGFVYRPSQKNTIYYAWDSNANNMVVYTHRDGDELTAVIDSFNLGNLVANLDIAGINPLDPLTNNGQLATTTFVQAQKTSPAFSGTPTAPTQQAADNSTRLATTAFANAVSSVAVITDNRGGITYSEFYAKEFLYVVSNQNNFELNIAGAAPAGTKIIFKALPGATFTKPLTTPGGGSVDGQDTDTATAGNYYTLTSAELIKGVTLIYRGSNNWLTLK